VKKKKQPPKPQEKETGQEEISIQEKAWSSAGQQEPG
jgi:hypothetical protein